MQPSPAEVARTLAAGHLPGRAHITASAEPYPVRHATDDLGGVLLLDSEDGPLTRALHPADGAGDTALVLEVEDVPPVAGSPRLGKVWVCGWAARLPDGRAKAAAIEYAAVRAIDDLLDVGRGFVLHRMEPVEIRLERAGSMIDIDPEEYAGAEPDPLFGLERELLMDLADHHVAELAAFVRRQLAGGTPPGRPAPDDPPPRMVRLDRYGFVVELGPAAARYRARLAFPRPMRDHPDLSRFLHPVVCRNCSPAAGSVVIPDGRPG